MSKPGMSMMEIVDAGRRHLGGERSEQTVARKSEEKKRGGSRGVKCSWKEMQRVRQVLAAMERGDGEKYAMLRCVKQNTVSAWKQTSEVMEVLEDREYPISDFSVCQPAQVLEIARHFRKLAKPEDWDEGIKDRIVDWVGRCEEENLKVKDLRRELSLERVTSNSNGARECRKRREGWVSHGNEVA